MDYYRKHGRKFPWRKTRDPYAILVSEVMLQQTQADRVAPFFVSFLNAFPTVERLARASLKQVLRVWSGLGYNRRALFLKRAAEAVMREHRGVVPRNLAPLDALPGVGRDTASAVLAFAWNERVVFVETNIRTVFLHHFFPRQRKVRDEEVLELVRQTLPIKTHPFSRRMGESIEIREWYDALMDYGAMLKHQVGNPNIRSAHYVRQKRFVGSRRELRGAILRKASRGEVHVADFAAFQEKGLPVSEILSELAAEGFLRKEGRGFRTT